MYDSTCISKFIESERIKEVTRGWTEGQTKLLINGYRVSVWDNGKVLKMDHGDVCTTL